MLLLTILAWVIVRPVGSGLSSDILSDVSVALSIDIFSMKVLMSFTLFVVVEIFLLVVDNFVSISWMRVFVLSVWLEKSNWLASSTLSLFSMLVSLRFVSVVIFIASVALLWASVAVVSACFANLEASSVLVLRCNISLYMKVIFVSIGMRYSLRE